MKIALCTELRNVEWFESRLRSLFDIVVIRSYMRRWRPSGNGGMEMRIALCSYSQKEKETALLMKLGKVDRFDNGVFCTYAMQRDGPYDAVVVMEDGARGMNFCMSIRGYSRDVPLLWISDQAEFEPQSRRMQADTFLVKPVTEYQLREAVSQLLQKTTRRNEQREEDE